jgi:hypothetical protein
MPPPYLRSAILSNDNGKEIVPGTRGGVFNELSIRIKLIIKLLLDRRVNPLLKLLPIGSLVYLISPFDLPTPVDDAILIWIGNYLFVELCPDELVQEHMDALTQVIEGEWHEVEDDELEL